VHLRREVRVHRMIRQLVPALSGCWPGDILVILLLGETNLTRKIHGPKSNRSRKAVVGLARRTRSRHWFVTVVFSKYEKIQEFELIKVFTSKHLTL